MKGMVAMETRTFKSVRDLVVNTAGPDAGKEMDAHTEATKLVSALAALRNDRNMSQRDIAKAMHCSHSKVSRIEAAADADLTLGDLGAYASALGMRALLHVDDVNLPAAQRIKAHVFAIKEQLDALAVLAEQQNDDNTLVHKINEFYGEVLFNFVMRYEDSYKRLQQIIVAAPATVLPPEPEAPKRIAEQARRAPSLG